VQATEKYGTHHHFTTNKIPNESGIAHRFVSQLSPRKENIKKLFCTSYWGFQMGVHYLRIGRIGQINKVYNNQELLLSIVLALFLQIGSRKRRKIIFTQTTQNNITY